MMWRWLDRERLLHEERVIGKERSQAAAMWFHRCVEARRELAAAQAERDTATEDADRLRGALARAAAEVARLRDKYEGNPS